MRTRRSAAPGLQVLVAAAAAVTLAAPAARASEPATEPQYEMTKYQFVMLVRDAARPAPTAADEARHRALLAELVRRGTAIVEGPVTGADFAELAVLDVAGPEAALAALQDDPLVAGKVLVPRVLAWYTARGQLRPPPDPAVAEAAVLGLLVRAPGAPDLPEAKLREIQEGHMANIRAMHAAGDLVSAGPFVDGGPLRGVFVFRTTDMARLKEITARDPAVAANRLAVQLFPWSIAKGTLPPRP
jgi:uncharacterized protein YciI